MSNSAHASLTGVDLHEPKGCDTAASGTVYVANGSGSGTWSSIALSLNLVGMVADFALPTAPAGWLEGDGSAISRTTYSSLFAAQTIQQSGVRNSGSAQITGLSSTANMVVGYYVGGAGITNGSTILSVDSPTQITISNNAVSSGTNTVIVSPWALGDGSTTFNLPDFKTSGRFRRSRTSSLAIGLAQASQNLAHNHGGTDGAGGDHNHGGSTSSGGVDHTHTYFQSGNLNSTAQSGVTTNTNYSGSNIATGSASAYLHTHPISSSGTHTHPIASDGGSEARPVSIVLLTCIKY